MRLLRNILSFGLLLAASAFADAQINSLPVKEVNGKPFHYYVVQPKETIYSLSRTLGVDRKEIEKYNPSVADGLRAGQTLYFPITEQSVAATHIVQDKETLYGISRKYGVSTDDLIRWNPGARDGIRPGQKLIVSAPIENTPTEAVAEVSEPAEIGDDAILKDYTIQDGQILYGIASSLGTSVDQLLALNPGLDRSTYKAGQVIKVPQTEDTEEAVKIQVPARPQVSAEPVEMPVYRYEEPAPQQTEQTPSTTYMRYDVKKKETFYSIARAHGLTVEDLEKANPTVGILKEGMVLNIPIQGNVAEGENPVVTPADNNAEMATLTPAEIIGEVSIGNEDSVAVVEPHSVEIALMLPLMLNDDSRSKQAQLYTEFYKGFLLAVDSMRNCGTPIHIQTYDTEASDKKIDEILSNPALQQAQVIIAPDSESHLTKIGDWARTNGVKVLNLFVVKDETYKTNPAMMQGNIPHTDMYVKAINGMMNRFSRFTPVIITRKDGPEDKAEYIKALKASLEARNVPYHEIEYTSTLRASDLGELPLTGNYAFIPASGRQAELNRIAPALIEFKKEMTGADPVRLFGYPEWTTFRGETLVNMHALNTLVYSRFYTVPEDPSVREVEDTFVTWYGAPMANFVPRQGLFGFDTGMYLINGLRNGSDELSGKAYLGVQNGFDFVRAGFGGWVNDELYFINFRPSGLIDKISL